MKDAMMVEMMTAPSLSSSREENPRPNTVCSTGLFMNLDSMSDSDKSSNSPKLGKEVSESNPSFFSIVKRPETTSWFRDTDSVHLEGVRKARGFE